MSKKDLKAVDLHTGGQAVDSRNLDKYYLPRRILLQRTRPRTRANAPPLDRESLLQATGDEIVNMNHTDDFFLSIKDRKH